MKGDPRLTVGFIQQYVAQAYGIDCRLLMSKRKSHDIVRPRQVAIWLTVQLMPALSLVQIGRSFGNRDVATVLHAVRRINDICSRDETARVITADLKAGIVEATTPPAPTVGSEMQQARELAQAIGKAVALFAQTQPRNAIRIFGPIARKLGFVPAPKETAQ